LISEYGIRNQGLSLIIFAGIVARIPVNFASLLADQQNRWVVIVVAAILLLTIFAYCLCSAGST
jgi:preprotein translocase subunit SecY